MNEEDYLKNRIDDQINWYNSKAHINKNYHYFTKAMVIIVSSIIPLIAGIEIDGSLKNVLLGLLGTCIAVVTGLTSLIKFQEKWSEYRMTAEAAIQEKILFQTLSGPYDKQAEPFKLLVKRVENLLSKEHDHWSQYINENNNTNA